VGDDVASGPSDENSGKIDGSCRVFRLVKSEWVKDDLSPPEPSSVAFQDKDDGMSVFVEDAILAAGRSIEELQKHWGNGYWVFSLTAEQLRDNFDQEVILDSKSDFPGHGLVRDNKGKRSQGTRSRMAKTCVLVLRP